MNRIFLPYQRALKIFRILSLLTLLFISLPLTAFPYKIQRGDTLYSISQKFSISVASIKKSNNITGNLIKEGTVIDIPSEIVSYKVLKGDTLYRLAVKTGSTVEEILALNGKPKNYILKAGTVILLKSDPASDLRLANSANSKNSENKKEPSLKQNSGNQTGQSEQTASFSPSAPIKATPTQSSSSSLSVLLLGDSLAYGSQSSFAGDFSSPKYRFESKGVSSSGLVCDNFFDWIAEAKRLSAKGQWDKVIIMLGANDGQAFYRNGREIPLFSNEWYRLYKEEAKKLIRTFSTDKNEIFWLSIPPMSLEGYNSRMIRLNNLIKEICMEEDIRFVDLGPVIGDANGAYINTKLINGQWQTVRTDGIHYSFAGSRLIADKMLRIIENRE